MAYEFAGAYDAAVLDSNSQLLKNTAFELVTEPGGVAATLYTDRLRSAALPQPFLSDAEGNVHLFTDPGRYRLRQAGSPPGEEITVQPDPDETEGELEAHVIAADPHPVYLTTAEGNAAYAPITEPVAATHVTDPTDAHDASAVSFVPTGTIAATDVQAAIVEVAAEASGELFYVTPQEFGAIGDGVANDSPAFASAMGSGKPVIVPQGTYRLATTLDPPEGVTVELLAGAHLRCEASPGISLRRDRIRFLGPMLGPEGPASPVPGFVPNIFYAGPANGVIIDYGPDAATAPGSIHLKGHALDATGVAGVTGVRYGVLGGGAGWGITEDLFLTNMAIGIDVRASCQQMTYRRIYPYITVSDVGIRILGPGGAQPGGAITTNYFYDCVVNSALRGIVCGSADGVAAGGADIQFHGCNVEAQTESLFEFWKGGIYRVDDCHLENNAPGNQPTFIVGRAGGHIDYLEVASCQLNTNNAGPIFEGHGWLGMDIHDNLLVTVGSGVAPGAPAFNNVGDGDKRQGGKWRSNQVFSAPNVPALEIHPDATGFELYEKENVTDFSGVPSPELRLMGGLKLGSITPRDAGAFIDMSDAPTLQRMMKVPTGGGIFSGIATGNTLIGANAYSEANGGPYRSASGPGAATLLLVSAAGAALSVVHDALVVGADELLTLVSVFDVGVDGVVTTFGRTDLKEATLLSSSLRIGNSSLVSPVAPVNGDLWFDGVDLFFRKSNVTNKITMAP